MPITQSVDTEMRKIPLDFAGGFPFQVSLLQT